MKEAAKFGGGDLGFFTAGDDNRFVGSNDDGHRASEGQETIQGRLHLEDLEIQAAHVFHMKHLHGSFVTTIDPATASPDEQFALNEAGAGRTFHDLFSLHLLEVLAVLHSLTSRVSTQILERAAVSSRHGWGCGTFGRSVTSSGAG